MTNEAIKTINASDIQPDDEWMQENEWDAIYAKEMTKEQFKKFAKEEFGYDISFEKSDEPDTYESLFGSCKGCEHAPTTYEEYCLHTCCPDAYTDKAAGCELFKKARNCGVEQKY